jgi:hypothetical protein
MVFVSILNTQSSTMVERGRVSTAGWVSFDKYSAKLDFFKVSKGQLALVLKYCLP